MLLESLSVLPLVPVPTPGASDERCGRYMAIIRDGIRSGHSWRGRGGNEALDVDVIDGRTRW